MIAASLVSASLFSPGALLVIAALFLVALAAIAILLKNMLYVCQPNEVLIFSGRARTLQNGDRRGYRVIRGGRALRIPLFETVDRMDLTNMIIDVEVKGAYSKGGIPLTVQGIANIKVPGEEPLLNNTLERFLGINRADIMKVARETLEGNLRGVLATLTPEQVNMDKERFARQLAEEAEQDLHSLGLVVDTLKIQNVSDEVGYLSSIGRQRSAEIRRDAVVAEARSRAEAAERKWVNQRNGEVAKIEASMQIAIKENLRRLADAQTQRAARIAKEKADVQALVAQAKAELGMQDARIEQTRLRLQADVIRPAEAAVRQAQELAKGDAAKIIEQGRATAEALRELGRTYNEYGSSGREVLLMQKLLPLVRQISGAMGELRVNRLAMLSGANGHANGSSGLAGSLLDYSEQIKAATGIDVQRMLARFAEPQEAKADANGAAQAASRTALSSYSRAVPPPPPQAE